MNNLCKFLDEEPPTNTKMCSKCREIKSMSDFGGRGHRRDGTVQTKNQCKNCTSIQGKFLQEARKNISKPASNHICPCCKKTKDEILNFFGGLQGNSSGSSRTLWTLDHDHSSLKVRKYICLYCNDVIGRSGDNPATLRGCADYLEEFSQ
tara:strand:- start:46 stop:495 length:450 start_codon:yes stop_codon:yes gene_type:complete